jgi:hypothetical protein
LDLYTANSAHSLHAQNAQRLTREIELRRIAKERAAASASATTPGMPEVLAPARPRRAHGLLAFWLLRGHRAAAQ